MSKYVFVLSFEKYAPKLQKIIETKSHKDKKVAKRDKISPFESKKLHKNDQVDDKISCRFNPIYPSITQVLPKL